VRKEYIDKDEMGERIAGELYKGEEVVLPRKGVSWIQGEDDKERRGCLAKYRNFIA